jgi:hypothetical protein
VGLAEVDGAAGRSAFAGAVLAGFSLSAARTALGVAGPVVDGAFAYVGTPEVPVGRPWTGADACRSAFAGAELAGRAGAVLADEGAGDFGASRWAGARGVAVDAAGSGAVPVEVLAAGREVVDLDVSDRCGASAWDESFATGCWISGCCLSSF